MTSKTVTTANNFDFGRTNILLTTSEIPISKFRRLAVLIGTAADFPTVDDAVNALTATILSAGDSSIPKTKGGLKTKYVPWWTLDLSCYRREKNDMLREYRRSSLILHKIKFMKARVKFRKSVKELRQQSWQNFISSINAQTHDLLHSGLVAQHHLKNVGAACLIHAFQK